MSRNRIGLLVLALIAGTTSSASAATSNALSYDQPVSGTAEFIGPRTTVIATVPAGEAAANVITDATAINQAQLEALDSTGAVTANVNVSTGLTATPNYNDATGTQVSINLAANNPLATSVASFFNANAGAAGFRIRVTTSDLSVATDGVQTAFDNADETVDRCAELDNAVPILSSAFVNQAGDRAFLVFNEGLNTGDANNDPNHTVLTNIDASDFQVDTVNSFDGTEAAPTGLSNPAFVGANNNVLRFDRNSGGTTFSLNSFVRAAFDNSSMPIHDVYDFVHNRANNAAVTIQSTQPLAVSSVTWLNTVSSFTNNQADRIRVVFNNPLSATLGDANFYNHLKVDLIPGGSLENSNISVDLVTADPDNPNAVLLRVDAGNETVAADGLRGASNGNTATGQYTMALDGSVGTPPQDIFSQNFTGTANPTVGDGIKPSIVFAAFGDTNPKDGNQDTAYLVFDEPVGNLTSATGFTLVRQGAVNVHPLQLINADGTIPDPIQTVASGTPANNNIPIVSVTRASIGTSSGATPTNPREQNNAICIAYNPLTFNWDDDANTGPTNDANEAVPSTQDANVVQVQYLFATGSIVDANGNVFDNGMVDVALLTSTDRAAPWLHRVFFFTGDNQNFGNSCQLFGEQDGELGDQLYNDRATLVASENLQDNGFNPDQVVFGSGGAQNFPNGADYFFIDNTVTIENDDSNLNYNATASVGVNAGSNATDGDDNELTSSLVAVTNRTAPYTALTRGVDGGTFSGGFLFDSNSDGFADQIRVKMTQPINAATLQASDFSVSLGSITAAALDGTDPSVIVISLTDGVVSINNTVTLTYLGGSDTTLLASSTTGGTGVAVCATNDSITVKKIQSPDKATQNVAIMDIVGNGVLTGTTPFPPGTKVYAMQAIPIVKRVTATHNNNIFVVDDNIDTSSLEAWTRWLHQIQPYIYLGRDVDNFQYYETCKDLGDQGGGTATTHKDVIALTVNATNLSAITFTGKGETSTDNVTNGKVELCWDVMRASDIPSFYDPNCCSCGGQDYYDNPILSSAVVTTGDGRFELHVSAPISAFDGKSRLNSIGRPIIIVVELTDGRRYAVSSLLSSVNGGPVLFNPQNRTQTSPNANNALTFNIDLSRVGTNVAYSGWNLLGFNRAGGYSTTTSTRPVLVDGVSASNIVSASTLPFVDPLDQFVWWRENTADGQWTASEDGGFSRIVIDQSYFDNFIFTMTSFGVQAGSGVNNIVGGYGIGFFDAEFTNYGVFQFGGPLTGNTLFTTTAAFPNNTTTQGWGLFTSKAAFDPAVNIRSTNNPKLDYLIIFRNNGNNPPAGRPSIEVSSLDLVAPTGSDNANDTSKVDAGQAFFGHFTP